MENPKSPLAELVHLLTSVPAIISSLGVIITVVSPVIALTFGSGSLALDQALVDEHAKAKGVDDARDASVPMLLERICVEESDFCTPPHIKNSTEEAILSAFELGTRLTMEKVTRHVAGPADLTLPSPPALENDLLMAIRAAIEDSLHVERTVVDAALQDCPDYFGGSHQYARLVRSLITAEVTRKALEASPGLVEKPEWWRDWLFGGGMALGGAMIGTVIGTRLWRRTTQQSSEPEADGTGGP